jgi:autotransporter passenger strand-loop-strand repeat protein
VITSTITSYALGAVRSPHVNNTGTITASNGFGANLLNSTGTLTNSGKISGGSGVEGGRSIVNSGTIIGTSGVGVALGSGETLVNSGSIAGYGTAVSFGSATELLEPLGGASDIGLSWRGGTLELGSRFKLSTTVLSGGTLVALSGGMASGGTIGSGGAEISSGGTASAAVVSAGTLTVLSSGTTLSAVLSGGTQIVPSGGTASGTVVSSGGSATVSSGRTAVDPVIGGLDAVLDLLNGGVVGGGISLAGGGGELQIGGTAMPGSTISGFLPGDTIDLTSITFDSLGSAVLGANNQLQVTEGGTTYDLALDPSQDLSGDRFHLRSDGSSGTLVTDTPPPPADFNGDGKSDILLENDNSDIVLWEMDGTKIVGGGEVGNPGSTWHYLPPTSGSSSSGSAAS